MLHFRTLADCLGESNQPHSRNHQIVVALSPAGSPALLQRSTMESIHITNEGITA